MYIMGAGRNSLVANRTTKLSGTGGLVTQPRRCKSEAVEKNPSCDEAAREIKNRPGPF